ncbi:hypothetical protein GCM10023225_12560 [Kineococcus glutinatus]|uniref:Uncharacterized protein n=1 Tax=Kineococcus glutinatus TaxID=1070872 RepID=A0ABP9HK81_9ACTN
MLQQLERASNRLSLGWRIVGGIGLAGLIGGIALGLGLSAGSDAESTSDASSAQLTPAPTVTVTVEANPASPIPATFFTPLPCQPTQWAAFLGAHEGPNSAEEAAKQVRYEENRARNLSPSVSLRVHATKSDAMCPAALNGYIDSPTPNHVFTWAGPAADEASAEALCQRLQKPASWDCIARPIG